MQARAYLEDLPGSASMTHKPHLGGHAPSLLHSTQHGSAPVGMDPYSQGMVHNNGAPTLVPPTGAMCRSLKEIGSSIKPDPHTSGFSQGEMMCYEAMMHVLNKICSTHSSVPSILDIISHLVL